MPPALSFSSLTMRWASLGPTPWARAIIALSPLATARWSSSMVSAERMASATRAPTPWTEVSSRNQSRSAAVAKPTSRIESSATSISVWSTTSSPIAPSDGEGAGRGGDQIADAVHVDHGVVGAEAVEQPAQLRDHAATAARR